MIKEVKEILAPKKGKVFVDGTCGLGGHAEMLAESGAKVIAIDKDEKALAIAKKHLGQYQKIDFVYGNFADLDQILKTLKIEKVDGILLDLGPSSMQFDDQSRGFSFKGEAPLDMRMDQKQKLTAAEIINSYPEAELVRIFCDYGEEPQGKKIAAAIVTKRAQRSIRTTQDLLDIIGSAMPPHRFKKKIHFATHIFRSLRMAVNSEVENLIKFFYKAPQFVRRRGKIVIISFHSIEDRIVKRGFKMLKSKGKGKILTKKPIVPSAEELNENPRARSAKLRAIEIS